MVLCDLELAVRNTYIVSVLSCQKVCESDNYEDSWCGAWFFLEKICFFRYGEQDLAEIFVEKDIWEEV